MQKWICEGECYEEDSIQSLLDIICDPDYYVDDVEAFDDYLNETEDTVWVCGRSYSPSEALYCLDQDTYSDMKYEWAEQKAEDAKPEMEENLLNMDDGEERWFNNYFVRCEIKDEEEDEEENEEESEPPEENSAWQRAFSFSSL